MNVRGMSSFLGNSEDELGLGRIGQGPIGHGTIWTGTIWAGRFGQGQNGKDELGGYDNFPFLPWSIPSWSISS
ncbi:Hypothetical protein FKW44_018737 [Caligus rogercresseyi]|uniref:Uncharacterized protein n=1 Tax=Caligus rogercresseyi TaxID=217165 RepID=A0A7T8GUW8_CALRO|nr:Hypothetical protein FKW44_018737 [Caligus rogercresseyi]